MTPWELSARLGLAIAVTLVATHAFARVVGVFRQPPVVGEMIAGLLLGPSLLGALPGNPSRALFPSQVTAIMMTIAEIGLVLYLLFVGIELGEAGLATGGRSLLAISLSSLAIPFVLGILLATHLYESHHVVVGKAVQPLAFAIFMGTAFSTTAFPVLVRILTDTGLDRDRLGRLAIRCAAILDVLGWILLALALAIASSKGPGSLVRIVGEGLAFVAVLVVLVRPLLGRVMARRTEPQPASPATVALVVVLTFASAETTQAIGLHPMLGAVLFGVVYPRRRNPAFTPALEATLRPVAVTFLLPLYFLLPGLTINLRQIGIGGLRELALILLVACAGKFLGAGGAALASGYGWRDSTVMGTLMNTRGLIELVILNVGLSAHVLDHELYGLMVIMALSTTMMTGPLLNMLYGPGLRQALTRGWNRRAAVTQTQNGGYQSARRV